MANVVRESVEGIGISKLPQDLGCPAIFTEVAIPEIVKIPDVKPDMEQLLSVMVDAKIVSLRIIDTPIGTSHEGQKLTGKKLSVELLLKQKVKYIADEPTQSVHAAHFEHTVNSIWVIVPDKINCTKIETLLMQGKLIVTPYIEDIYGEQLDKRTIFKNITVLVHVTSPCLLPSKADLKLLKTNSKTHVKVGDTITYTVIVKNTGTVKATDVIFKDNLSADTEYVSGTFKVNGSAYPAPPATPGNPTIGVNIGDINSGASKIITFDVKVNSIICPEFVNIAEATYKYITCDTKLKTVVAKSNGLVITVDEVSLSLIKTADRIGEVLVPSTKGQTVTYTIVMKNEGTITLDDIVFTDALADDSETLNATFKPNTFSINGSIKPGINPTTDQVQIGSLDPDESIIINFDVDIPEITANKDNYITVTNQSKATYKYTLDQCNPLIESSEINSNSVSTKFTIK